MLIEIRPVLFLLCFGLGLFSGCGQQTVERGNYLDERAIGLVGDAAAQIVSLYPPAKTRFVVAFEPDESDLFGLGLVGKLREAGYAVQEGAVDGGRRDRDDAADVGSAAAGRKGRGLALSYVVDEFDGVVRVLVHVGNDSLSRVYDVDGTNGNFLPAGGWAWRRGAGE